MIAFLLSNSVAPVIAVLAVATASVLKKWIEETFRTRRLVKSIEGAEPLQRPEIIRAYSQLEDRSTPQAEHGKSGADSPGKNRSLPLDDHSTGRAGR